jgi:SAM-dependent methyltransferase
MQTNSTKLQRTHDSLYLLENRYEDPKQLHQQIVAMIKRDHSHEVRTTLRSITDAGCAAGEFAYLLRKEFMDVDVQGFDLLPSLISKARERVSGTFFFESDILDASSLPPSSQDVITCTGVISIFDDFRTPVQNLIDWVKPGGYVYLHSLFSDYPFDVRIQYNSSADYGNGILETGWNIFSKQSVSTYLANLLENNLIHSFVFDDFKLERELAPQEDLARSWTFRDHEGKLRVTNGLNILQPHAILTIRKAFE